MLQVPTRALNRTAWYCGSFDKLQELRSGFIDIESHFNIPPACRTESRSQLRIAQQRLERIGKPLDISWSNEQPALAIADDFRNASKSRRDYWPRGGHSFENNCR
jgi:hypothetical protein